MEPGKPCVNCTKQGCKIYEKRPVNPCVTFECAWLKEPGKLPEHMKPSECGAIVILDKQFNNQNVIRAVPVGNEIPRETLEWLTAFARHQLTPLLLTEHVFKNGQYVGAKKSGYGPPSFTKALERGLETKIGIEDVF